MSDEKKENWEMPKPVFKSSEGSLPKSLEETISQSFIANAETLEIDEDDDILGIMDTLPNMPRHEDTDDEVILETDLLEEGESAPETDTPSNEQAAEAASSQPISVTAKEPDELAEAKSGNSSMFVIIALVAAVVVILLYYFSTKK